MSRVVIATVPVLLRAILERRCRQAATDAAADYILQEDDVRREELAGKS